MAQLVVRNIENAVKSRLQQRAARHRQSMEEEVRDILRDAAKKDEAPACGLGTDISCLFARRGLDADIEELRGYTIQPAKLEQ
jgi:antitoxin FitA